MHNKEDLLNEVECKDIVGSGILFNSLLISELQLSDGISGRS